MNFANLTTQLIKILSSQVVLGVTGLLTLPIIARNLGVKEYGVFSLFVIVTNSMINFDIVRPLLTREYTRRSENRAIALAWISMLNVIFMICLAVVLSFFLFSWQAGSFFILTVALYMISSPDYAILSLNGKIGTINLVRYICLSLSYCFIAVSSFYSTGQNVYIWQFALANLVVLLIYRRMTKKLATPISRRFLYAPQNKIVKFLYRKAGLLILFNIATFIVIIWDRALLERWVDSVQFGSYMGQLDIAIKFNMIGSALSSALYPLLIQKYKTEGIDKATGFFIKLCFLMIIAGICLILPCIIFSDKLIILMLGAEFLQSYNLMPIFFIGVYLQFFGFLTVPWLRVKGDFYTPMKAYWFSASLKVSLGTMSIVYWDIRGAAISFFIGRSAEIYMILRELLSISRSQKPHLISILMIGLIGAVVSVGIISVIYVFL
jgi:O-antigen/teichoic acid export membrane protein